jgi:hypothetical protein
MLWTMALKDRIVGTTNNTNVIAAVRAFGQNFPSFQSQPMYAPIQARDGDIELKSLSLQSEWCKSLMIGLC